MGEVKCGEEVDVEFLEFRQLRSQFSASIERGSLPRSFGKNGTSILAIEQEIGIAFWAVNDGVAYATLTELVSAVGPVKKKLVSMDTPVLQLLVKQGWLIVATTERIIMYKIDNLEGKLNPIQFEAKGSSNLCATGDYICWLDKDGKVSYALIGEGTLQCLEGYEEGLYAITAASSKVDTIVAIAKESDTTSLLFIEIPTGKVSKETKLPTEIADCVGNNNQVVSLGILGESHVAIGLGEDLYIAQSKPSGGFDWLQFKDPARGSRKEHYLRFSVVSNWSKELPQLLIIGDTASPDLVCGGLNSKDEFKMFFIVSDEGLLQLPLAKGEETFPMAMALDFTSGETVLPSDPETPLLPPQPILWIINTEGVFCPFYIVNKNQSEPHPLMKQPKDSVSMPKLPKEILGSKEPTMGPLGTAGSFDNHTDSGSGNGNSSGSSNDNHNYYYNNNSESCEKSTNKPQIESILPKELPMTPTIVKISEDLGLLNNAIASEMVELYESFNADVDRMQTIANVTCEQTLSGRSLLVEMERTSIAMAKLSFDLDKELSMATAKETRLMGLFSKVALGKQLFFNLVLKEYIVRMKMQARNDQQVLPDLILRLGKIVDHLESSIAQIEQIENVTKRRELLKTLLLPQLEQASDMISTRTFNGPVKIGTRLRESPKWEKLHLALRQRPSNKVLTTEKSRKLHAKNLDKLVQNEDRFSPCRPPPPPLDLPSMVVLNPIERSNQTHQMTRPLSVIKEREAKVLANQKVTELEFSKAKASFEEARVVGTSEKDKPLKMIGSTLRTQQPQSDIKGIKCNASQPSPSPSPSASFPTLAVAQLPNVGTANSNFSFEPSTKPTCSSDYKSGESYIKTNTFSSTMENKLSFGFSLIEPMNVQETQKAKEIRPHSPEKTLAEIESADNIKSPTPKGPKSPMDFRIPPEQKSSNSLEPPASSSSPLPKTLNFTLGELSLGGPLSPSLVKKEDEIGRKPTIFSVPDPDTERSTVKFTTLQENLTISPEVRPSELSMMESLPDNQQTSSTSWLNTSKVEGTMPTFGLPTAVPAFGAPTGFGALSGNKESFPFKPATTNFGFNTPTTSASTGFSAFANTNGFASLANSLSGPSSFGQALSNSNTESTFIPGTGAGRASTTEDSKFGSASTSSIFGSASNQQQTLSKDSNKKDTMALFTQFRG